MLVARLLGVAEFALGSTMVFRAETLRRIGGFPALADYLADDYQLGKHIAALGYSIALAPEVVQTDLGAESWADTWQRQVRWARTIRVSRPSGYYGYVVTHATLWALMAFAGGWWRVGIAALAIRMVAGTWVGRAILKERGPILQARPVRSPLQALDLFWWRRRFRLRIAIFSQQAISQSIAILRNCNSPQAGTSGCTTERQEPCRHGPARRQIAQGAGID